MKKLQSTLAQTGLFFKLLMSLNTTIWKSPVRLMCLAVCCFGIFFSLIWISTTLTTRGLIDAITLLKGGAANASVIWVYAILFVILIATDSIIGGLEQKIRSNTSIRLSQFLTLIKVRKMSTLDLGSCDNPSFHDAFDRAERGMYRIEAAFFSQVRIVRQLVVIGGATTILALMKPSYVLVLIISIIPSIYVSFKNNAEKRTLDDSLDSEYRKINTVEYQFEPSRIHELFVNQSLSYFLSFFETGLKSLNKKLIAHNTRVFYRDLIVNIISSACTAYIIIDMITMVISNTSDVITLGSLFVVFGSIMAFKSSVMDVSSQLSDLSDHISRYKDFKTLLETKPTITQIAPGLRTQIEYKPYTIEFRNVWFRYPNQPESNWILKGINLTLRAGEKIALVGENGAGKSTLLKLLTRMYDPVIGEILINGTDIRKVDLESFYNTFSYVGQNHSIYPGFTVGDNIRFGEISRESLEDIVIAAKRATAHPHITSLENNYNQVLGNEHMGGVNLSGGEKQKVTIARAFYRNPLLFMLDEPTANIDALSETSILNEVMSMKNISVLLVAHRITTITFAERIVVVEDGTVAQDGTHQELILEDGPYKALYADHCRNLQH